MPGLDHRFVDTVLFYHEFESIFAVENWRFLVGSGLGRASIHLLVSLFAHFRQSWDLLETLKLIIKRASPRTISQMLVT